jgi:hypothetical protein
MTDFLMFACYDNHCRQRDDGSETTLKCQRFGGKPVFSHTHLTDRFPVRPAFAVFPKGCYL